MVRVNLLAARVARSEAHREAQVWGVRQAYVQAQPFPFAEMANRSRTRTWAQLSRVVARALRGARRETPLA